MKVGALLILLTLSAMVAGCGTPSAKVARLRLGMTPEEVIDQIGKPTTIRAAKVYEDGQTLMVWEYLAGPIAVNPKNYWVFFENDRVVQWGEPGDFAGKTGRQVPIDEYKPVKQVR